MKFWPCFYNHWNFGPILTIMGIFISSLHRKHWNSGSILKNNSRPNFINIAILILILPNTLILALFLYTLVFWSFPSKPWDSSTISISTGIMISSLKTLDFLFFQTLEFWSYSSKQWNSGSVSISIEITSPIFWHIGILILSFQTLRYWPFLYKHWTYNVILGNVGILALFLYILELLFYPSRSWYSIPISMSIVILMLFFQTIEFWPQFL